VVFAAAFLQGAVAQVAEQQTTVADPTAVVATKPKIDCKVSWSESWTKCSPDGFQTRRYTVDIYPTRAGKQCPQPQKKGCTYPGSQTINVDGNDGTWGTKDCAQRRSAKRTVLNYLGETHESFSMSDMCQHEPIKVTVGDVLVFVNSQPTDDVFALPSQWHYAECNFTDGGYKLPVDPMSTDTFRYTIRAQDSNTRLYLASSRDSACSKGQRVLVSVDDFKQGTLAEALDLINNKKSYETEEGAIALIERIWCFEDHCPMPAMGFYEGNEAWSKERCKADAYSLLGFVYRKRPKAQIQRAEEYYKKALELVPEHCEATEYMGELYIQMNDFTTASATFTRLQALKDSENTAACANSLTLLQEAWNTQGWCPPPVNSKTACVGSSSAASSSAVMMTLSSLLLVTISGFMASVF